jgi:hypothetical protein
MDSAKISLSPQELALVTNAEWILTKNTIIGKVYTLFGQLAAEMNTSPYLSGNELSAELSAVSPKISRGENYCGLPWLMLDYPRIFTRSNSFAIRSFFWWGNFFSITLYLKGTYKERFAPLLLAHHKKLADSHYYVCVGEQEWEHYFLPDNYLPLQDFDMPSLNKIWENRDFIKISAMIPLADWEDAGGVLFKKFGEILNILST